MSNKNIYKDEFGVYREADEEVEEPLDGFEDDEQDLFEEEDDAEDPFDSLDEDSNDYDEDEDYARSGKVSYESEDDD